MNEIIVTGMGVLSTAGSSLQEFWDNLTICKKFYGIVEEFKDDKNYRIKIGARILSDAWLTDIPQQIARKYGQAACYAARTAKKALDDSAIHLSGVPGDRISVVIGTTMGEIGVEEEITKRKSAGMNISDELFRKYSSDNIVNAVKEVTNASGNSFVVPAACAAGNYAVSIAKKLLEWNQADVVIAGGVDVFSFTAFAGFQRLLSLDPLHCRPFDKNRRGLVVGEGCGMIVMERAGDRKAEKVYGKVLGAGLGSDAFHMTALDREGCGEMNTMLKALDDASLTAADINYISAHGTGTKLNDFVEAKAISRVFGKYATPVSSMKSFIGHSMGAASILELIGSFLMLKEQIILPTVNIEIPDDEIEINHIMNAPQTASLNCILSNSFAFGGQTSSIVISR